MSKTINALALTFGLLASGSLVTANAQGANPASVQNTRATSVGVTVKQDLADWRQAGFDEQTYRALSQDVYGKAYQQRYAEYQRLRQLHSQAQN